MNMKFRCTIVFVVLLLAQRVPLGVMARELSLNTTKSSFSAPVYPKLGSDAGEEPMGTDQAELAEICAAAFLRSKDIQFVMQKFVSDKDRNHSTASMNKSLFAKICVTLITKRRMSSNDLIGDPNMRLDYVENRFTFRPSGPRLVLSAFNVQANVVSQRKAPTETDATMLYSMIRNLCFKLSDNFYLYKRSVVELDRVSADHKASQRALTDKQTDYDSDTQMRMEFQLRKNRREIEALEDDARKSREALVAIAGDAPVDRLDGQIEAESHKNPSIGR